MTNEKFPHQSTRTMGRGMMIAACVLGLGLLTLFYDGLLDRQINPNTNPASRIDENGVREVVLRQNRQGHYVTSGAINGKPVRFLLDTGATDVAIPLELARSSGLAPGYESRASTANGATVIYDTRIDELQLGDIQLYDVDASIVPNMQGDTILLGMSALRHIEFSQRGDALTLRQLPVY
ncbi:MAG: TIGR02281 family clan AA aspartic protease [Gammaproteobacteria bacterium]|nr:TIGR02281 family clan AA aspartic protease [Pseudomonadales bacterium]MCP5345589.1 TIGR02281 family clan AA aspartic protease [Pseudomonadales bacterium]